MKVKIFNHPTKNREEMEKDINNFIKNKKVVDIRASTSGEFYNYWNLIVILYEDKKENF